MKLTRRQVFHLLIKSLRRALFLISLLLGLPVLLIDQIFPLFPVLAAFFSQQIVPGLAFDAAIGFVLGTAAQLLLGWPLYRSAWQSLSQSHSANMDLLLSLSTLTAYCYSVVVVSMAIAAAQPAPVSFFETPAVLLMLVMLGRYLESAAKGQTSRILVSLADLQPPSAILLQPRGAGGPASEMSSSATVDALQYDEEELDVDLIERGDVLKASALIFQFL